jgi:hypothetical protein
MFSASLYKNSFNVFLITEVSTLIFKTLEKKEKQKGRNKSLLVTGT